MIRVLIVDDHTLVRAGLCRLLEAEDDTTVVGQTGSGHEALGLCEELEPDLVILDYSLPDMDGLETAERLRSQDNEIRILILTMYANEEYAIRLLRAGTSGFIVKGASPEELLRAVRTVAQGGTYVTPGIQEKIVERVGQPQERIPEAALSNREMQVLLRLARGATSRQVASELALSLSTVETHRNRLLHKLNLRNNSDITRFAIRRGLIDVD
jgi:DNA-binding NarL/FixJ family response regulator